MTVREKVRKILSQGEWLAPYEIQAELEALDTWISESATTARTRDLKKPQFGHYPVVRRRRAGTNFYEYKIQPANENRKAA